MLNMPGPDEELKNPIYAVSRDLLREEESGDGLRDKVPRFLVSLPHKVPTIFEGLRVPTLEHGPKYVRHERLGLEKPSEGNLEMLEFYRLYSVPSYRRDHAQFQDMGGPSGLVRGEPGVVGDGGTVPKEPIFEGAGSLF